MTEEYGQSDAAIWRDKYNDQRKKSRILAISTAVCAVVAVGLGVWGVTQSSDSSPQAGGPGTGQMGPGGGYGMPGGGQMPDISAQLFNDDGSVNTEALQQFLERSPNGDIDQFLQFAQQGGQLTDKQVEELTAAAQKLQSS